MSDWTLLLRGSVKSDWVDYNGHMADYAYGIVFSDGITAFMDLIGVDKKYRLSTKCTMYTLDVRISYLKECHLGQRFRLVQKILDSDAKRYHAFNRLIDEKSGIDVAWCEQLAMHMQQAEGGEPKSKAFPSYIQQNLENLGTRQRDLQIPDWVGGTINIRRKKESRST